MAEMLAARTWRDAAADALGELRAGCESGLCSMGPDNEED